MMVALGKLAAAALGVATVVNGLGCVPTAPASLSVSIGPGEIYALQSIDSTAYGSIAADTAHQVMKQGIQLDAVQLACPAPATSGNSIAYLIQASFSEVDGEAVVLPYYNASNPAQAYSGPAGAGTTNNTSRDGKVVLTAKAGVSAATGTQVTPAPDSGYVGLWVVTVANGQASIAAGNIAQYSSSPMMANSILAMAQASVKNIKRQVFTTSGTYIPSAGLIYADVEIVGGGGGSGGALGSASPGASTGGGGGAGGYSKRMFSAAQIGGNGVVIVGAGGTGGAAGTNNGTNGGTTTFTPANTGTAGLGAASGGAGFGGIATTIPAAGGFPGSGGVAIGGDINVPGDNASYGIALGGSGVAIGAPGASSRYGSGGLIGSVAANGNPGTGYGSGGSGAAASTTSRAGANGAPGICIVTEYCNQ